MNPANVNQWPKEALQQFAQLLAPLIAKELHANEQRQSSTEWNAQLDPAELKRICSEKFKQRRKSNA